MKRLFCFFVCLLVCGIFLCFCSQIKSFEKPENCKPDVLIVSYKVYLGWGDLFDEFVVSLAAEVERPIVLEIVPSDDMTHLPLIIQKIQSSGIKEFAIAKRTSDPWSSFRNKRVERLESPTTEALHDILYPDFGSPFLNGHHTLSMSIPLLNKTYHTHRRLWRYFPSRQQITFMDSTGDSIFLSENNISQGEPFIACYLRIEGNPELVKRKIPSEYNDTQIKELISVIKDKSKEIEYAYKIEVRDSWTGRVRFEIAPYGKYVEQFFYGEDEKTLIRRERLSN